MKIHKLSSVDAFLAFDLGDAPAAGVVRSAPKILQGGAKDMARSLTYTFASFEMQRGGVSGGINAKPEDRDAAIASFAEELAPMVADGKLFLDPAKGVTAEGLAPLGDDGRNAVRNDDVNGDSLALHLAGLGPAVAAQKVTNLDGATVAIEGFGAHGPALAEALEARGAKIVGVSTADGAVLQSDGISAADLRSGWAEHGPAVAGQLGGDAEPAWKVFQSGADILLAGSKVGAINHTTAEKLSLKAVVPHGPLPITTRAVAILQRSGATVLPDFITTAGPIFASWPTGDAKPDAVVSDATAAIEAALDDTMGHDDGAFLGACYRAEAFLKTWQDALPFGRPLA